MTTNPAEKAKGQDVEAAKVLAREIVEDYGGHIGGVVATLLASHTALEERIASLEAVLEKARVSIACYSPDPTEPLQEIDALLSGKATS